MKKLCSVFILFSLFFLTTLLSAQEQPANTGLKAENQPEETESYNFKQEKDFFTQLNFGIGADFTGNPGMMPGTTYSYFLKNQLGITLGLDFNWLVFKKESGRGEGNLYFGFGFDFQYWAPTTWLSDENTPYNDDYYYDDETSKDYYMILHYMRIPVTLNLSYELKAGIGALESVEPRVSFGINSNIFKFGSGSSDKEEAEELAKDTKELNRRIYTYKISGTWSFGVSFVFTNNWFFSTSIGGDFGSQQYKSELFYLKSYKRDEDGDSTGKLKNEWRGRFLYGHHEFIMFETGYRF